MFITFEGPEGAGKTTVLQEIAMRLEREGYEIVVTREPGGIAIAESIREVLLHPSHTEMDGMTETLLYAAARRQHLVEKVIPALEKGKVVLCDRFIDSSLAYQGYARGIGVEIVYAINQFAIDRWMPKHTLFFDLPPEQGLARIAQNVKRENNRLDQESLNFHYRVYEGYQQLIKRFPERIQTIDASRTLEDVIETTYEQIKGYLE